MTKKYVYFLSIALLALSCTTQQKVVQVNSQTEEVKEEEPQEQVLKRKVAIGRFSNETRYAKGIFYDKENDPIGKQAADILSTKLASSNKFLLLERQDLDLIEKEMEMSGNESLKDVGADYLIIGSVTEFGRQNEGDSNVFSRSKTQTVYAGVNIRLVDVSTGQIIYSEEAKGEAETSNKTVMGFGESADYDSTLNDKAISAMSSTIVWKNLGNLIS